MNWLKWGDKVTTPDGKPATVREAKPGGEFVVVRVKGERHGRSYWSGNLKKREG